MTRRNNFFFIYVFFVWFKKETPKQIDKWRLYPSPQSSKSPLSSAFPSLRVFLFLFNERAVECEFKSKFELDGKLLSSERTVKFIDEISRTVIEGKPFWESFPRRLMFALLDGTARFP